MFDKKIYILIALLVLLRFASGEIKVKGSIAFVIDDTDSMSDEIYQVQKKTDDIFDAVFKSDASQIDEFIIVTFNDPGAHVRINTDHPVKFKRELSYIYPFGGDDCPEMAMKGIKLALDESKPNSFLYIFTDASAKDYMEYENVKSLALEKSIQINFLLTGKCDDTIEEQDIVYDRLAAATSGQVLHIGKLDISKIIKYILANLSNKRTILLHKTNGCDHLKFTVDSKVWDIYIALSAPRPIDTNNTKFTVFGPDGNRASTLDFIKSENTTIVQLKGNPGEYSIDIRDCEKITVVVSAATSVSFRHGFSPVRPSSIDETSTKPLNGIKSYLAIALDNDNRDVTLKTVEIRDMDDKLVQQLPLKLVDEEEQFYITDLFTPPEKSFKVAINGYTKLNEKITRVSQTSIEYHRPESFLEPEDKERSATITVIGPKEVLAEYNEPLMLKCKVTGFPKPETRWLDEFDYDMKAEEQKISPYEYISVLHIDKVTMNETYTCKAVNYVREYDKIVARDYVSVIVGKRSFFHVLEYPTDVTVEFGKPVELNFKINAKPSATITWYQDNKIITNSEDITISSDGSSFNIKSAKPSLEGEYYVTASNGYVEKKYQFIITVTIKEKPAAVTILGLNKIIAEYDQPLSVKCKVKGFPKPNIIWEDEFHRRFPSKIDEITPYEYLNTLYIDKVTENVTYICKANNILNEDSGSIQVITKKKTFFNILEYPKDVAVEYNKSVELNLKIDAMPPATIIWFQVDKEIRNNHDFHISADGSLLKIKNAQPGLEGKYYVKATNGDEKVKYEFDVTVIGTEVPRIDKHVNSYTTLGKSSVDISCRVMRGKPEPTISWSFDYNSLGKFINLKETTETIHIENVTANDIGTYRCNVSNVVGSDHHEMQLYIEGSIKIETPKQTTFYVKLESALILPCHVTGYPKQVIWLQYPTGPVTPVKIIESDKDNNVILQNIQYEHEGLYICRAINNIGRDEINYTVNIQEVPRIDKHVNSYTTLGKSSVDINCRVMQGKPEPTISWSFDYNSLGKFINLKETTETIHIENVTANDIGTYRCNVSNVVGSDHHEMQLYIEGSIKIETPKQTTFYVKLESALILPCHVTGYPEPTVKWFQYPTGPETAVKEIESDKDNNVILQNIQYDHEGLYICRAINNIGRDEINYTVNIQEVPRIDKHVNSYTTLGKSSVDINCRVMRGKPEPTISWSFDYNSLGKFINLKETTETIHIENVTANDIGTYRCNVSNVVGSDHHEMQLDIEGSIKIETPKQTTFYVKLESVLILPCHVTGYPKQVTWFQYPTGPETPVKEIKSDKDNNVILQNIQYEHEGLYICRAINSIGRVEINYTVNVQDPTHNISLVEGDLQFSLSCFNRRILNTTVTWTINGTEVGRGEGFDILRDGNLTASNVTMRHKGTYICKAENGGYRMEYEVDVHKFPHIVNYSCPRIIPVAEGKKVHTIFCDKEVKEGDLARWFKDGKLIKTGGNFTFTNVTKADAGYYTCRYNPSEGVSCSFDNRVIVGTKPEFVTEASLTVKFKAGAQAHLDCSATGKPPPITKWYGKGGNYSLIKTCINAPQQQQWCNYTFTMHNAQNTSYMCIVSNEFDTIKRKFEIIPDECLMDLKRDFTAQQPLLVTGNRKLLCPVFNISDGSLKMHKHKKFKFFCPNSFISYNHSNFGITLETSCLGDSMFDLRGRTVKASEITCNTTIIPIAEDLKNTCLGSKTELNIGFKIDGSPVCTAFGVCFNEKTKTPIFAKHVMHKAIANTIPVHVAGYTRGTRLSFEFEDIYDCRNQMEAISSFTGKPLKTVEDEKCCFKKRQLVNPKDVLPGISQVTTYHYLNVVPQWSTCGTENWDEVERRVRLYFALNSKVRTMIWTGATSVLKNVAPIILKDKLNQELQVPQFIWKVVENQLAIIHINVPGLTSAQASSYTLCTDICESVKWMRSTEWHNVDKGFIYCCSIPQFEQAFHYEYIFAKKIS